MNAQLFRDLSDASDLIQIEAGKPIYESITNLDDKVILVNGEKKTPDYIPQEGDIIAIRSIPRGLETLIIAFIVVAVAGAIVVGYQAYKLRKQAEKLEEKMKNMQDEIVNVPYLKGARNSVATGKSQPYIIGEHFFTPYLLSKGYRKISGTDGATQHYYVVLEGGFNQQVLRKLYCDDVALRDFGTSETVPQEGIYYFDEASPFNDADSFIEVSQDGNAFATAEFNAKVDIQETGAQVKKADSSEYEDLLFTLPQYSKSVNLVLLFNGLRAYNADSGAKIPRAVRIVPSYSLDSGATWTPIPWTSEADPYTLTRNTNVQMRFNVSQSFTWAQVGALTAPVLIKVACTTNEFDGTAYDDCYVEYIQSAIYNPDASVAAAAFVDEKLIEDNERALSTLIGLKIKSTASNADKLDRINVITSGVARTWDGTEWSATKVPTSNPAAWLLEVYTSHTHKPSQSVDAEIDLDSFGDLYDSCVTNDLAIDMVLTDGDTKESVIDTISQVCFASVYDNIYGKKAVAIDEAKTNAIAVINPQNVMSFSCEKDMGRKVDGLKVSFVNRAGGYVQDSYLVLRPGHTRTAESIFRDVSVVGIVRYDQIVTFARRLMAVAELRPKTVAIKMGHEGIYFTPLSKILVQHSALGNGLGTGAEIKAVVSDGFNILGLELYDPIEYDSENANGFGMVINCVSDDYSSTLAREYTAETNGKVYEIEFVSPIPVDDPVVPHAGDILSYGYLNDGDFDTITTPMLITSIEADGEGYSLALVDYNADIYTVGAYPDYTPNLTLPVVPGSVPIELPAATLDDVQEVIETIPAKIPGYRGRYHGAHPTTYVGGDWWLVYNDEGATGGDNVARGIYYVLAGVITLIDPTDTNVLLTKYRATTLEDVLWASNNGYTLIGTVNDPITVYGVTVMQYLAVNAAFVNYLGTNKIRLSSSGAMIGGSRYNDAGTVIDALATGVYIGADGTVKFESRRGGLVIDSATGTVTYTGVNVDLTDSALVSYEEGSATPKSFSHENLALVVRDFAQEELVRLQYEDDTGLWGGRGLGGEVDFVSSWIKDAAMGASSSLSALAITHIGMAMNRGTTALALANVGGIAKSTDTLSGSYPRWTSVVYGSKLYIPIGNQNLIEIYDLITGDVTTDTLSGAYDRRTCAIYGSKLYIPIGNQNLIEIYDLITGDVTTDTLSGAYDRRTCAIYGSKLYIPITLENIIEIYDLITGDVTTDTLSGSYNRWTSVVYGSKLYIPITLENLIEIYDLITGDVTTDTLSGAYVRYTSAIYGSKLYIPITLENLIEIYDLITGDVTTDTLSGAYVRYTSAIYGSKLYIPQYGTDDMDIVQLPYTVGLSYASGSWSAAAEVPVYGLENITVTKMADGRHMVVGEKNAGVWYCIRATDGSYGTCVELQANAHSPTVTALPTGSTVCAYIHTATSYIGRKAWSGTTWGTDTSIELAATRPEFCVTEDYATLTYILTSTGKAFVIDCSDGTFPAATDTTVTAVRAQCQILPDLTYRLTYQLSTGYLYAAVGETLTSWTATALETSGVTDFAVGILGTGETSLLYAKSALLRRVDASAYAGTNETKLMRAGMGFVESGTDEIGNWYKLPNGEILRPPVTTTIGPFVITAGTDYTVFAHDKDYDAIAAPPGTPGVALIEFSCAFSGSVRLEFDIKRSSSGTLGYIIYKNNVSVAAGGKNNGTYETKAHNITSILEGDVIRINYYNASSISGSVGLRNFRLKSVETAPSLLPFCGAGFRITSFLLT